mmetsp:Transcript_97539/g.178682  ORF Transcript_97539/g.178682 Transcript_97539/m.178682 type:complete len:145 (-) Transcript_97539:51-485(-)
MPKMAVPAQPRGAGQLGQATGKVAAVPAVPAQPAGLPAVASARPADPPAPAAARSHTVCVARSLEEAQAKLERSPPPDEAAALLNYLSSLPIDVHTLARTKIGKTVNSARREYAADRALAAEALALIERWKRLWQQHKEQAGAV